MNFNYDLLQSINVDFQFLKEKSASFPSLHSSFIIKLLADS